MNMTETKDAIEPDDIEWVMPWSKYGGKQDGSKADELIFEEEYALAHMLINEVVFLNSHWWRFKSLGTWNDETKRYDFEPKTDARWTKEESELISVSVNCNDIFAWGCADAEDLPYAEIENLYRLWRADPAWGVAKWCAIRRKLQPQGPVIDAMKKAGSWDHIMENLIEKDSS
jgi:hypothetical protein